MKVKEPPLVFMGTSVFNGLMILPFGGLLERKRATRHVLVTFVTATVISSIAFHLLTLGQKIQATGISAIGYTFTTEVVMLLPNIWKEFSCIIKLSYLFLIILSSLMLLPMITGWISTFLRLSGTASYLLVLSSATALREMLKASIDLS